jgi:PncC family amidohydrolase
MDTFRLENIVTYLEKHHLKIVTAESCTASLIASTLAEIPGSGKWLESAFVTYSENAKVKCLNISETTINQYSLISQGVAAEMAEGALRIADTNLSLATTGLAGPQGEDNGKAVGTVCIAWSFKLNHSIEHAYKSFSEKLRFSGKRNHVRTSATEYALEQIEKYHQFILPFSPSL